ncbi:hypothetical protein L596_003687 [Steinernema carpocapsae]|uniref:Uncharacterized protein n=1 Tax=Steinernema carpocapsae TaxID=34508 RepID=A0A4U8UTD9_STECR|nr:hypothetical protein L596_003687 [Steinernema carpocapsae]
MGLMSMVPAPGYRNGSPIVAVPTSKPLVYKLSGGIKEHRAALLASHGFAVLCLPYFSYKNLREMLIDVDLDYFQVLLSFQLVFISRVLECDRILLFPVVYEQHLWSDWNISRGSNRLLVKAIVTGNCDAQFDPVTGFHDHGELIPTIVEYQKMGEIHNKNGVPMCKSLTEQAPFDPYRVFQVEKSAPDTKFYFITSIGVDSDCSVSAARVLCDRLRKSGHKFDMDIVWGGH